MSVWIGLPARSGCALRFKGGKGLRPAGGAGCLRFFRSRAFSSGDAGAFFVFASLFGAVFFLPQFLQTGLGRGPLEAALRLGPWTGTLFVVAPIAGALADRIGERPLLVGGPALEAAGMAWIALIVEPGLAYGEMIAPLVVAGIGASMASRRPSSVVGAVAQRPPRQAAAAVGRKIA